MIRRLIPGLALFLVCSCSGKDGAGPHPWTDVWALLDVDKPLDAVDNDARDVGVTDGPGSDQITATDGETTNSDAPPGETMNTDTTPVGPGEPGYPCDSNDDCLLSFCVPGPDGKECAETCISECPTSWQCSAVQNGGETIFICIYPYVNLCRPCSESNDCDIFGAISSACVNFGQAGNFCGIACSSTDGCPEGHACDMVPLVGGGSAQQCVPSSGECGCNVYAIEDGATTLCYNETGEGHCDGSRFCTPEGLSACSALVPAEEICNGLDDNCDGDTDEEGALGCTTWFVDTDGDEFGVGNGTCSCEEPGQDLVTQGGDCNDLNPNVNPDATEHCNNYDDNCDDSIDELGAEGCIPAFLDADLDGHGDPLTAVCVCPPLVAGFTSSADDCDDKTADVSPSLDEVCGDGIDNNCNLQTDEENADGCDVYYLDGDGDGYGVSESFKCLCEPSTLYAGDVSGDCNDVSPVINPLADEQCNGVDDDCNGQTDELPAHLMCPVPPNGTPICDGECGIEGCLPGWYDMNEDLLDGCECKADFNDVVDNICPNAIQLGNISDSGEQMSVGGKMVPATDEDWYQVNVVDSADTTCDTLHFKVLFVNNPEGAYALDVYRGGCLPTDQVCVLSDEYVYAADFRNEALNIGQCPCSDIVTTAAQAGCGGEADLTGTGGGESPSTFSTAICDAFPHFAEPNMNYCSDDSSSYYIRVYLRPDFIGIPPCAAYELEISNGIYQSSATGP